VVVKDVVIVVKVVVIVLVVVVIVKVVIVIVVVVAVFKVIFEVELVVVVVVVVVVKFSHPIASQLNSKVLCVIGCFGIMQEVDNSYNYLHSYQFDCHINYDHHVNLR
jgi:hypothetical protein